MSRPVRAAYAGGVLVLGAASGLASVAVHDRSWWWLGLAVVAPVATAMAVVAGVLRIAFVAGWSVVLALAVLGRPEGDYAIRSSARGYVLLVAGMVLLVLAVATVPRPVRASP